MNPDRMRSEYGKLLYLLMDAARPDIQELLEFSVIKCASLAACSSVFLSTSVFWDGLFVVLFMSTSVSCRDLLTFWLAAVSAACEIAPRYANIP